MRQAGTYSGVLSGRIGPTPCRWRGSRRSKQMSGEDVRMISGEVPIVFSKECELFIEELTLQSWMVTLQMKRRTLHKEDGAAALVATDIFDFLAEMISEAKAPAGNGASSEGGAEL